MLATVMVVAADALGTAAAYVAEHPEIATNLIAAIRKGLENGDKASRGLDGPALREQLVAIASGMANARAVAVQEAMRSQTGSSRT